MSLFYKSLQNAGFYLSVTNPSIVHLDSRHRDPLRSNTTEPSHRVPISLSLAGDLLMWLCWMPRESQRSSSPAVGLQVGSTVPGSSTWALAIRLRPSCLQGTLFHQLSTPCSPFNPPLQCPSSSRPVMGLHSSVSFSGDKPDSHQWEE